MADLVDARRAEAHGSALDDAAPTPSGPGTGVVAGRTRWRGAGAWTAVVLAVAAAGPAWWWVSNPDAFADGPTRSSVSGPLPPPGTSLLVGLGVRPLDGRVTLLDVTPVLTANTADARLRVVVCDRPRDDLPPGVVEATAESYCGRVTEVRGYVQSAVRGGPAGPTRRDLDGHVVVEITPARVGTVAIRGARVRYRDGLRRGTQTSGLDVTFTTR